MQLFEQRHELVTLFNSEAGGHLVQMSHPTRGSAADQIMPRLRELNVEQAVILLVELAPDQALLFQPAQ